MLSPPQGGTSFLKSLLPARLLPSLPRPLKRSIVLSQLWGCWHVWILQSYAPTAALPLADLFFLRGLVTKRTLFFSLQWTGGFPLPPVPAAFLPHGLLFAYALLWFPLVLHSWRKWVLSSRLPWLLPSHLRLPPLLKICFGLAIVPDRRRWSLSAASPYFSPSRPFFSASRTPRRLHLISLPVPSPPTSFPSSRLQSASWLPPRLPACKRLSALPWRLGAGPWPLSRLLLNPPS